MDRLGGTIGSHDSYDDNEHDLADDGASAEAPPSPVGQDERRMQVRAYNHWAGLLGDNNFPSIGSLEPEKLDDFGPYSVLLDFTGGIEDPAIRFLGGELASECDADEKIDTLADVPSLSLLSRITDHYMQILANQAPIGFEAEFVNQRSRTVLYRGILLPFTSDGNTIDFIFGVINWKEMANQDEADELLLEIDQALNTDVTGPESSEEDEGDHAPELEDRVMADPDADLAGLSGYSNADQEPLEIAGNSDHAPMADVASDDAVLDLGAFAAQQDGDDVPVELPVPAFGAASDESLETEEEPEDENPDSDEDAAAFEGGHFVALDEDGEPYDYGLSEFGDEAPLEDVDDVVDPLADEKASAGLTSLVSRGDKAKAPIGLSLDALANQPAIAEEIEPEYAATEHGFGRSGNDVSAPGGMPPAIPSEYVPEETPVYQETPAYEHTPDQSHYDTVVSGDLDPEEPAPEFEAQTEADAAYELTEESIVEDEPVDSEAEPDASPLELTEEVAVAEPETTEEAVEDIVPAAPSLDELCEAEPDGLYDTLAVAREAAQQARSTEDRSRKALYEAVGRAYDFSLEAQSNPDDFAELIAENGLSVQERAPMTPIVKLVFGADYDKTRLTEYATVLAYAHRNGVERGGLVDVLRSAEGGLKGIVQDERRARREEAGEAVEPKGVIRAALASKLLEFEAVELDDIAENDGAEFALLMVRRTETGEIEVVGEVPDDVKLVERAARKLLK
ncbi:PAS domain-containing protein [Erythrobacter sp. W53]|uniref:PAS domain-containing protein n=1 Tax=Erythrobacter sp. W53 TaxID=3425947 RepID=UPI003D768993